LGEIEQKTNQTEVITETNFKDFLETAGIVGADSFLAFLDAFNADPKVFYQLSDAERTAMDGKMDRAFDAIFNSLGGARNKLRSV